ncbi:MAG: hypothetical protein O2816_13625 [Planctomycetota bacterium]|nr:hypothetical protein [Planctomycetota bacterium]
MTPRSLALLLPLVACGAQDSGDPPSSGSPGARTHTTPDEASTALEGREADPAQETPQDTVPTAVSGGERHPDDPMDWAPLTEFEGAPVETVRETFPDGELRRIATHHVGRALDPDGRHGPEWTYFKNDIVKERLIFVDGVPQGPFVRAWPNGQLRFQGTYKDGQRHAAFQQWFQTGDLQMAFEYDCGNPVNTWREFYVAGHPKSEEQYLAGKLHGARTTWSKPMTDEEGNHIADGVVTMREHYQDGLRHGPWQDFDPAEGTQRTTGHYDRGSRTGHWTVHWKGEVLIEEADYVDNLLEGLKYEYTSTGQVILQETWEAGVKTGPSKAFYHDGTPQSEGNYQDGLRQGQWKYYTQTGELNGWSGVYENDEKVGPLPEDS